MKVYKVVAYLYLAFAVVFAYDVYDKFTKGETYWISLLFVAVAIFMFIFRLKNANKFGQNNNHKE